MEGSKDASSACRCYLSGPCACGKQSERTTALRELVQAADLRHAGFGLIPDDYQRGYAHAIDDVYRHVLRLVAKVDSEVAT